METKDILKQAIYKWVAENYGQSEADEPSWDIESLANELAKHRSEIYLDVEWDYLEEDCKQVAKDANIELTEEQRHAIVAEFINSETHTDLHRKDWLYFINRELKRG